MEDFRTLCPETAYLVEALHSILFAENKCLDAFCNTYGEEKGNHLFEESGIAGAFDSLREKVHNEIGLSVELGLTGMLSRPSCLTHCKLSTDPST